MAGTAPKITPSAAWTTTTEPAPDGNLSRYIRAYWGEQAILDGTWLPPKIETVK
ncbi:hypothetical protein AAEU41_08885 [Pantoea agglomerans]